MAQIEINTDEILKKQVEEIAKASCVVNTEPELRFKRDDEGNKFENGYRTELQVMSKGLLYRKTFNFSTPEKPDIQVDDTVKVKIENSGTYTNGRKTIPWFKGTLTKLANK